MSEQFANDSMSFKSSPIQHHVHFANYGPIRSKIGDKTGYETDPIRLFGPTPPSHPNMVIPGSKIQNKMVTNKPKGGVTVGSVRQITKPG